MVLLAWIPGIGRRKRWREASGLRFDAVFLECTVIGPQGLSLAPQHHDLATFLSMKERMNETGLIKETLRSSLSHIGTMGWSAIRKRNASWTLTTSLSATTVGTRLGPVVAKKRMAPEEDRSGPRHLARKHPSARADWTRSGSREERESRRRRRVPILVYHHVYHDDAPELQQSSRESGAGVVAESQFLRQMQYLRTRVGRWFRPHRWSNGSLLTLPFPTRLWC